MANTVSLKHALVGAIPCRPISTSVLPVRRLSHVGVGDACCTLIFTVVWSSEDAICRTSRACVTITMLRATYSEEDEGQAYQLTQTRVHFRFSF